MKALILNSGMGSRMGDETKKHPKCMTVLAEGETILSKQLRQLKRAGIEEVIMTTGYQSNVLEEYCKGIDHGMRLTFVYNELYSSTNYIYSIYKARDFLKEDIIMLHGDLVFDDEIVYGIINKAESCMAVESSAKLPEKDFKAVVVDGKIRAVGIDFFENAVAAQPLYKLLWQDWRIWLNQIIQFCEAGDHNCYAENAFNEVSSECLIYPYDVGQLLCREIDTVWDWEKVKQMMQQ